MSSRRRSLVSTSGGTTLRSRATHPAPAAASANPRRDVVSRGTVRAMCTVFRSATPAGLRSRENHRVLRMPCARRSEASRAVEGAWWIVSSSA